jgi:outer membrane protein OmpA-like peptidoglycan-associated protein
MLLLASALTACSTQSERGSTGTESQAPAAQAPTPAPEPAPAPQPEYVPEAEGVQYSDAPLPPAEPARVEQPVEEFPITRYELPAEEEEMQDLGPLDIEEDTATYAEEATPERDLGVSEPTEATEEEHVVEDLGPTEQEEATAAYDEEPTPERDLGVSEPTEEAEEAHVVEDLGPIEQGGETLSFAEEQTPRRDSGVSEPRQFADEPVAQAQPPKPVSVSFEAEADPLFNFDRANIRSDQRDKLDDLVSQLNGASYGDISVTGHADRIGTEQYNQKLSERRANAVKAYLVRKGVPASRISVNAMGESQPATTDEDCRGQRGRALIACYEPDRRVEVSVNGQKEQ